MTALAMRGVDRAEPAIYQPPALTDLEVWAASARQATAVAEQLALTPFVPDSLRGKRTYRDQTQEDIDRITVGNIVATILTGQELGLKPMASLRSTDVIQGTPALRAITMRALVQAHGHDVWLEDSTATRAIVAGQRRGSNKIQKSTWTTDRARALGLLGKDNWRKQPMAMLIARATGELCRLVAADVIMAMPYTIEELADGDVDAEIVIERADAVAEPVKRTARRRNTPAPAPAHPPVAVESAEADPEPDFDEDASAPPSASVEPEPDAAVDDPEPDPITAAQLKKLQTTFTNYDITDRDTRLRVAAIIIGRDLESSKDLTKNEATALIDTLDALLGHGDPKASLAKLLEEPDADVDEADWADPEPELGE